MCPVTLRVTEVEQWAMDPNREREIGGACRAVRCGVLGRYQGNEVSFPGMEIRGLKKEK